MSRAGVFVVALLLIAAACTGSGSEPSTTSAESPPSPSESAPSPTARPEVEAPSSSGDGVPSELFEELGDYTVEELGGDHPEVVDRLDELPSELFDSDERNLVRSDEAEIVVALLTPAGQGRGDPALADAVAAGVAQNLFADPEFVDIDGTPARRLFVDDQPWYFWASNTRLFVVVGEVDEAEKVLAELIELAAGEYQWQQGDCLRFESDDGLPFAPFGVGELVDCESSHTHEVSFSDVLAEGRDVPFPAELNEQIDLICGEAFADYVGAVPRLTTLRPVTYRPDQAEWAEGDRYMACVVGAPIDGEFTESIEGEGAEYARNVAVGDCMSDDGPVECDEPHWGEIIAIPTFPGDADDPYPGDEEIADLVDAECRDELARADTTSGDLPINVRAPGLTAFDWAAGSRQFECLAFVSQDGLVPSDVLGSFTGEWRTVGEGISV